jgi:zinc protease
MKTKLFKKRLIPVIIGAFLLSALFLTCVSTSSSKVDFGDLGKPTDKVPLTSEALTGTLPNGLKYYILENPRPENRAQLALVVNAGSVLETNEQRGYAHFIEHMAFKGTARFPEMDLINYLRSLGMRFGPDANAYTSYDETVYHFEVPVDNVNGVKRIPNDALAIIDDWSYAVSFNPQDVDSERLVVLEELRSRLGARDRIQQVTLPILFAGSAYQDRRPIGLVETIEKATSEKLKAFYSRWYTSDNMAVVIVGDFNGKALEEELQKHFNMPKAGRSVNRPRHELPPPKSGNFRVETILDPEITSISFSVYYKQKKSAARGTLAYYRETIVDYLIDTMLSDRFEEASINPDAYSTDSWGGIWRWGESSRFYVLGTDAKIGGSQQALKELLLEKEAMRRYGFTQSEFERAKLSLISYMERQLSEKDRLESRTFIRGFTSHILYGEDMADIEWEMNAVNSLLPGISLSEVTDTARRYFSYNDCNVFITAPAAEAADIPSADQVRAIFREAERAEIAQRQSDDINAELLEKEPQSGTIASETVDADTGAVILVLSNGAKVILKQTANRNNEIIMYAMARGGTLNAPAASDISASLAAEMISVSGLGPYTRMELLYKLAGKQVSSSFWASNYYRGFQGSSTKGDLKTLFEMLYLFFTNIKLDERAINAMKDQYRTNLIHQEEDPQRYFSRELSKIINNNHPRFKPLEVPDLDKISLDQAVGFIRQCINISDYTFVFTGNIDISEMKDFSCKYIASIKNTELNPRSMTSWTDPGINRPGRLERNLYKGKDQKSIVYLSWIAPGAAAFSEDRNQVAAVLSEYLDILLTDEIREKMSGVYSISSGASVSVIPKGEYSLSVYFQCSPERTGELIEAVKKLVAEIYTRPVHMDIFYKSIEALLMSHETSIQRNLHIAQSYANSYVLYNTPLARLNKRPDSIIQVTAQDMQELCRQMLSIGPTQVVLYPEGWQR